MKSLKKHTDSLQDIYDYFGYEEKCKVFPIDDRTDYYWDISEDSVIFCNKKENMIWDDKNNVWTCPKNCHDDFFTDEYFYGDNGKNIYFGKKFTMIVVDTRTDGNSFLAIYDNNKKL